MIDKKIIHCAPKVALLVIVSVTLAAMLLWDQFRPLSCGEYWMRYHITMTGSGCKTPPPKCITIASVMKIAGCP